MAKRGILHHPKLVRLARELDIDRSHALGILESLWHFTHEYSPDGNVGRIGARSLAINMGTSIGAFRLVHALIKTGWLDETDAVVDGVPVRFVVHDWAAYNPTKRGA